MKAIEIYKKALSNGVSFECDCSSITLKKWNHLMENSTRADKRMVHKILKEAGCHIDNYFNPYNHYKTNTHIIYVHSAIEHFYRIN